MMRFSILLIPMVLCCFCSTEQPGKGGKKSDLSVEKNSTRGDFIDITAANSKEANNKEQIRKLVEPDPVAVKKVQSEHDTGKAGTAVSSGLQQPLYVIDGVVREQHRRASAGSWGEKEYNTPLDIPPEERESVEVLTGAEAIALYGERGRNGVVIIKTKRGKKGKVSYIESSGDTVYTRGDAASLGMQELMREQKNNGKKDH
ncbi:TonB-dependent receptor plug domain-containing protein [Fodinibius sediminis]|uniref:TonB-dependent outer membrane receptor, SusC/RagA subfamily, signature region n=1 Tax=Fodinibius sediminis TaxID=1214077 RepID=A0A521DHW8_9BACT|nr:TonB-dependent receptor plug domain-containing protein [Fodinibius sediminis]SMO71299.1 TonB-dependent outer membrane receptor, SusC/RagA subfamily, signature region [Fodinibius sediminis]